MAVSSKTKVPTQFPGLKITRPEALGNYSPSEEYPLWSPSATLVFLRNVEQGVDDYVAQRGYTPVQPPPWKQYYGVKKYNETTERMVYTRALHMVRLAAKDGIELNLGQAMDTVRQKWQAAGVNW